MADEFTPSLIDLKAALASGVLTIESHGRRKTYRSTADLIAAIKFLEADGKPRRRGRVRLASLGRD